MEILVGQKWVFNLTNLISTIEEVDQENEIVIFEYEGAHYETDFDYLTSTHKLKK